MPWWKWAAGLIVAGALATIATLWALTAADVLRWGATAALHERIEALEEQGAHAQEEPTEDQFIVVSIGIRSPHFCMIYTSPGGTQERCIHGDNLVGGLAECYFSAVIGEPLPACWRGWPSP